VRFVFSISAVVATGSLAFAQPGAVQVQPLRTDMQMAPPIITPVGPPTGIPAHPTSERRIWRPSFPGVPAPAPSAMPYETLPKQVTPPISAQTTTIRPATPYEPEHVTPPAATTGPSTPVPPPAPGAAMENTLPDQTRSRYYEYFPNSRPYTPNPDAIEENRVASVRFDRELMQKELQRQAAVAAFGFRNQFTASTQFWMDQNAYLHALAQTGQANLAGNEGVPGTSTFMTPSSYLIHRTAMTQAQSAY
jgi:hypothetical protein